MHTPFLIELDDVTATAQLIVINNIMRVHKVCDRTRGYYCRSPTCRNEIQEYMIEPDDITAVALLAEMKNRMLVVI